MFYLIKFSEKHNYYIEYDNNVYLNYFYENKENCFIGVILENISHHDKMDDEEIVEFVDTKIFTFLNHVFSCKNINSFCGLTHPNINLFNKFKGQISISQLLFASEKKNIVSCITNYLYNLYKQIIYNVTIIFTGSDIKFVNRVLEIQIQSSEDDAVYTIKIISQEHSNNMVKANIIKKLYKIYQT